MFPLTSRTATQLWSDQLLLPAPSVTIMTTKSMEATSSCIPSFAQTLKLAESLPAYSCENGAFYSEHDIDSTGAKSSTLFLTQVSDMSQCTHYVQSEFDSISKALAALAFPLDPGKLSVLRSKWDGLDRRFFQLVLRTRTISSIISQTIDDFLCSFVPFLRQSEIPLEAKRAEFTRYQKAIEELKNGTENRSIEMELDSLISDFNSFDVDWANFSALLSKRSIDLECTVAELRLHVDQTKRLLIRLLARTALDAGAVCILIVAGVVTHSVPEVMSFSPPILKRMYKDASKSYKLIKDFRRMKREHSKLKRRSRKNDSTELTHCITAQSKEKFPLLHLTLDVFPRFWSAMTVDLNSLKLLFEPMQSANNIMDLDIYLTDTTAIYQELHYAFSQYARAM